MFLVIYSMYHLHLSFPLLVVQNYAIHIYACSTSQLKIVLNTPKTLYLNQGPQKITCQIFLPQNKMEKKKNTEKNTSIIPINLTLEYPQVSFLR